jgi:nicotinic acid mononucleotide adenylyltransferase
MASHIVKTEEALKLENNKQNIILVLSGALNPCHSMHIRILEESKTVFERDYNANVVCGYLCPSGENYVNGKLGKWAFKLKHRVELCKTMLDPKKHSWIKVMDDGIMSGAKIASNVYEMHKKEYKNLQVFQVYGADFCAKTRIWLRPDNNIVCMARKGDTERIIKFAKSADPSRFIFVNQEFDDLSSTKIRECLNSPDSKVWNILVENKWITKESLDYMCTNWNLLFYQ